MVAQVIVIIADHDVEDHPAKHITGADLSDLAGHIRKVSVRNPGPVNMWIDPKRGFGRHVSQMMHLALDERPVKTPQHEHVYSIDPDHLVFRGLDPGRCHSHIQTGSFDQPHIELVITHRELGDPRCTISVKEPRLWSRPAKR
jgi:hypothetical protein